MNIRNGNIVVSGSGLFGSTVSASFVGSFTGSLQGTASYSEVPKYTRRHDYTASYSYCGTALSGSSESSNVWDIARIFVSSSGETNSTFAYSVAWTDRYTVNYN